MAGSGIRAGGVRREVAAGLLVAAAVVTVSLVVGVLWGLVSPTEQLVVTEPDRGSALIGESLHQFDAVAMFVCFGAVTGLVAAVAVWRLLRPVRGPLLQLGLLSGSLVGAYAMARSGETVADLLHPRAEDPAVGTVVTLPTGVGTGLALLVQPLIASLVVLFFAALSTSDDLGTGYTSAFGHAVPTPRWSAVPAFDRPGWGGGLPGAGSTRRDSGHLPEAGRTH
ncbi:DUF2567 domain-containing protein [Nocardia higoensis]|uniref:DUF2567 domain-containing protein n=1 Tax=Nocardia higoensis TaxID=228599 RepID=A0ABS0DMV3_9NOCA|nr:DUF2567 domain-containing protein [Nocardia higoensis]MBF6358048.1 DUF2567 domain-containing protein [Nocardia higoensis]